jgi:hypothetical protein
VLLLSLLPPLPLSPTPRPTARDMVTTTASTAMMMHRLLLVARPRAAAAPSARPLPTALQAAVAAAGRTASGKDRGTVIILQRHWLL